MEFKPSEELGYRIGGLLVGVGLIAAITFLGYSIFLT